MPPGWQEPRRYVGRQIIWTNLIVMLALLTAPVLVQQLRGRPRQTAAAFGAACCFVFTASGHFLIAEEMRQMLPAWVPWRLELVWATGLLELLVAAGLLAPRTRRISAWAAIAVLVVFFPANVYAAVVHAPVGGHALGPAYLPVRAPVQLFMIGWIYAMLARPGQPRPR